MSASLSLAICLLMGSAGVVQSVVSEPPSQGGYDPILAGVLLTSGGGIMPQGRLLARPTFNFSLVRGSFDATGRYTPIPGDEAISTSSVSLYLEYGLSKRLSLAASVTGLVKSRHTALADIRTPGFADSVVALREHLFDERGILRAMAVSSSASCPPAIRSETRHRRHRNRKYRRFLHRDLHQNDSPTVLLLGGLLCPAT